MGKLFGASPLVFTGIRTFSQGSSGHVKDAQIHKATTIPLDDVRHWLHVLHEQDHVELFTLSGGLGAAMTSKGHLALGVYRASLKVTDPIVQDAVEQGRRQE